MQPAGRLIGKGRDELLRESKRRIPVLFSSTERPLQIQNSRMHLIFRRDQRKFHPGLGTIAQLQPAAGGVEVMGIGCFDRFHAGRISSLVVRGNALWFDGRAADC